MIQRLKKTYCNLPIQLKASFWFLICSFLQKGISILTTPIFTRLLTTAEYGNYSVYNSWLSIVTIFVSLNLYFGVYTSGLVKFQDERAVFVSSLQGLSLSLCIFWTILYILFHSFWNQLLSLTTVQMLSMFVLIWTSSAFRYWAAEQRVEYKYKLLVIVSLMVSFFKPVIGIVFVTFAEDKVTARILGLVLVEIIGYTGLFVTQMKKGKVYYSKKYWNYALTFALPLVPHYLSQTVLNSADRIMIREMVGSSQAGIYSVAYSVSQIMRLFNTALTDTIGPWFYQKIKNNDLKPISGITNVALIFVATVNLILISLAPEIVALFAPKEYHQAIWVIPPVAMSVYLIFMYDFFARFEVYYEKTLVMMLASIAGALLNIILNYFFIDIFGYIAAAYTTLICYTVYVVCHYMAMKKICDEYFDGNNPFELKTIIAISLGFCIIGFLMMATYRHAIIRYCLLALCLIFCLIKRSTIKKQIRKILSIRKNKHG